MPDPTTPMPGRWLRLSCAGWRSPPVRLAGGFGERLRGTSGASGAGLLLWARSVHGVGMRSPLLVLRLTPAGVVAARLLLRPGRVVVTRSPGWFLELPANGDAPSPGSALTVADATAPPRRGGAPSPS